MNELDLIRAFRADVPGPDAAAIARAERAWRRSPRTRRAPRAAAGLVAAAAVAVAVLAVPAAHGTRRWTTRPVGSIRFPSAQGRERLQADGRPELTEPPSVDRSHAGFVMGSREYSYRQLLALPRDPRALYARFHSAAVGCQCGNGVDDQTFVIAVELLRSTPLPTDLRSAILQATA